jgi:hypothetical protein
MSLSEDLRSVAGSAATLANDPNPANRTAALEMIAIILGDLAARARSLEGTDVPPHWRRQDWDGAPYANIRPLRRG